MNEKRSSVCRTNFGVFCLALSFFLGFIRQHHIWARVLKGFPSTFVDNAHLFNRFTPAGLGKSYTLRQYGKELAKKIS